MDKRELFKTAKMNIACAKYAKDEYVNIRYAGINNGKHWFFCWNGEETPENTVVYPEHHLYNFGL